MKIKQFFILLLLTTIILQACTIQKRVYKPGYTIDFYGIKNKNHDHEPKIDSSFISESQTDYASVQNEIQILNNSKQNLFLETCDNIILKNGTEIKCKVEDIGLDVVKYKKCENLTGPSYSILKKDIFMIQYANGTKDVFKDVQETQQQPNTQSNSNQNNTQQYTPPTSNKDDNVNSLNNQQSSNNQKKKTPVPGIIGGWIGAVALILFLILCIGFLISEGLIFLAIPVIFLSIVALVLEIISNSIARKNPEKYIKPKIGDIITYILMISISLILLLLAI